MNFMPSILRISINLHSAWWAVVIKQKILPFVFSLDISKAYPENAKLKSWKRTITLNRKKIVIINESYELEEVIKDVQLTIMSCRKPELETKGKIKLQNPEEIIDSKPVVITYDNNKFDVNIEEIYLEDRNLRSSRGDRLFRIVFTLKKTPLKDEFSIFIGQK